MSKTLAELATETGAELKGDPTYTVSGAAVLQKATASDVSFLGNSRYRKNLEESEAGAVFISPNEELVAGRSYLIHENPSHAFQMVVEIFYDVAADASGFTGIHSSAVIHETAMIGNGVSIGPHAIIDRDVQVGNGSLIGAGVSIGPGSTIGEECFLHPNVTIRERCLIGNRVILQPGVVVGSCGYGYSTSKEGKHIKQKQIGTVIIEDDVEIGANTTIDRARLTDTRIGRGTKIDNLVMIGHAVRVGEDNLIVAQTGIAGSTEMGRHVILGGQVGIVGHVKLDDGVIVAAQSGVSKSLPKGKYCGSPAIPLSQFNRNNVLLRKIQSFYRDLEQIKKKIQ